MGKVNLSSILASGDTNKKIRLLAYDTAEKTLFRAGLLTEDEEDKVLNSFVKPYDRSRVSKYLKLEYTLKEVITHLRTTKLKYDVCSSQLMNISIMKFNFAQASEIVSSLIFHISTDKRFMKNKDVIKEFEEDEMSLVIDTALSNELTNWAIENTHLCFAKAVDVGDTKEFSQWKNEPIKSYYLTTEGDEKSKSLDLSIGILKNRLRGILEEIKNSIHFIKELMRLGDTHLKPYYDLIEGYEKEFKNDFSSSLFNEYFVNYDEIKVDFKIYEKYLKEYE